MLQSCSSFTLCVNSVSWCTDPNMSRFFGNVAGVSISIVPVCLATELDTSVVNLNKYSLSHALSGLTIYQIPRMFTTEHRVCVHSWDSVTWFMYAGISPRCEILFQEVAGQYARVSFPSILVNRAPEPRTRSEHVYREELSFINKAAITLNLISRVRFPCLFIHSAYKLKRPASIRKKRFMEEATALSISFETFVYVHSIHGSSKHET